MLRLPAFTYTSPRTLGEAMQMLAGAGGQAAVMAGGTDLLPHMKRRQRMPRLVIGLRGIADLPGIGRTHDGGLRIGAGCTLAEVARDPLVRESYPALAEALGTIASPAIRQMGTIGGNLCIETRCRCYDLPALTRDGLGHCLKDGGATCLIAPRSPRCWAVASSDAAPILVAMDAKVRLASAQGQRVIPLTALYADDGLRPLTLGSDEILTEILLPATNGMRALYKKMRVRGAIDFAAASVAVALRWDSGRMVADARIVVGAVASAPVVAKEAAHRLIGQRIDAEVISDTARMTGRAVKPLENADLTASWRRQMVQVATARALSAVASASA